MERFETVTPPHLIDFELLPDCGVGLLFCQGLPGNPRDGSLFEGLGDDVGEADLLGPGDHAAVQARRDHDGRYRLALAAKESDEFQSRHEGHDELGDDQVKPVPQRVRHDLLRIRCHRDLEAGSRQFGTDVDACDTTI